MRLVLLLALGGCTRTASFTAPQRAAGIAAAAEVDGSLLMSHVEALVAGRKDEEPYFPPESRYAGMPFTHVASAAYVASTLAGLGLEPRTVESGPDSRPITTVYADLPGTTRPDEIVLVSAHHDAWFVGADDNATGVAVILEVARVLADAELDRTVRIISFDREEEGLVGAAAYAATEPDGLYRIVNLDSVGYTDASQESLLGLDAPDTGDFLAVIAPGFAKEDLLASLALGQELPDPVKTAGVLADGDAHVSLVTDLLRSDHAPFWERGVPGLFFTDTTEFRNPRYHTPDDTIDTLNPTFLAEVGGFTAAVVAAYAEAE